MIIVANFKAYKTDSEVLDWLTIFNQKQKKFHQVKQEVVICPPATALAQACQKIKKLKWQIKVVLGCQNISSFPQGPFTGEITVAMVKDYAKYVLIGHSERRRYFSQENQLIEAKIKISQQAGLIPIVCVSQIKEVKTLTNFSGFLAYEPLFAIGSGQPATFQMINTFARQASQILNQVKLLYGGSVDSSNIAGFKKNTTLAGFLVGKASLDPLEFAQIVAYA